MMTSRTEYRLIHRQDNADIRLCEIGNRIGLVSDERLAEVHAKYERIAKEINRLEHTGLAPSPELNEYLDSVGFHHFFHSYLQKFDTTRPKLTRAECESAEISIKYDGYIRRQLKQVEEFAKMESRPLPEGINYDEIIGLRLEARQKLGQIRPKSLGQASRISGVSPADVAALMVWLQK